MKPGMTRSVASVRPQSFAVDEMVRLDLLLHRNWSLLLDLKDYLEDAAGDAARRRVLKLRETSAALNRDPAKIPRHEYLSSGSNDKLALYL